MRVLNVCLSTNSIVGGGTGERTSRMSLALARAGVDCVVLELDCGISTPTTRCTEGVEFVALPCANRRFHIPRVTRRALREIVTSADIIHLMGHWTPLNLAVFSLSRKSGIPHVVCPAGALPIYGRSRHLKRIYNMIGGSAVVKLAAAGVAITAEEVAHFLAYGVEQDNVLVIPNGIAPSQDDPVGDRSFRRKYDLPDERFVLFIGRLNPIKGPDLLLEAFSELREAVAEHHLVFAGPDEGMQQGLMRRAQEVGVAGEVHFIGPISGGDKAQAFRSSDLVVIPSRQEAMSIVVLEAGAQGKPVLMTEECGFPEVAAVEGGLVVPATVDGLRDGLVMLLKDSSKLAAMGRSLKKLVLEEYSWDSLVERYVELYRSILSSESR